jgi:hypothetical protein
MAGFCEHVNIFLQDYFPYACTLYVPVIISSAGGNLFDAALISLFSDL